MATAYPSPASARATATPTGPPPTTSAARGNGQLAAASALAASGIASLTTPQMLSLRRSGAGRDPPLSHAIVGHVDAGRRRHDDQAPSGGRHGALSAPASWRARHRG